MPPLVLVATAWLVGLVVAHHWLVPAGAQPGSLVLLALIPLATALLWRHDRVVRISGACALSLLLGALRYQAALPDLGDPGFIATYNEGGWATVEGIVRGYPDVRDTWTNLSLEVESVELGDETKPVGGRVLVRAPRFPEYHYGDRLRVSGLLETPPEFEDFSYRDYLARRGVYSLISYPLIVQLSSGQGSPFWTAIYSVKNRARDLIARLVPDPEASLLQGILLGIESGIPADLYDDYNATGTSHIIVISGFNITIISALFARTFGRLLGKRRAYWFTMAGIILYVLLVGADAVVVRAGLMGALYVTARHLGRQATAYTSLFACALLLTLARPLVLWDVGFQLSFAATLGLILFTSPIERLFETALTKVVTKTSAREILRHLNDIFIVTLAAQLLTLPLVVYHFGRLVLVAPLANLLILPVQPPIMILGGLATLVGLVPFLDPVAQIIAWLPWLGLAYTNAIVRWMADWPLASLEISYANARWLLVCYGLVLGALWIVLEHRGRARRIWKRLAAQQPRWPTVTFLGVPLAAAFLAWLAVLQLPDGRLHIAFLDVGQGDAVLLTTPLGQQILVDGGPSPTALTSALGREMPFWDRSLDMVVMTHADTDHITGLTEVLDRFQVDGWLDSGVPDDTAVYVECQSRLAEAEIPHHVARAGTQLLLGEGVSIEVLHPPPELMMGTDADANNNSLVLRLVWGQASFLLSGDVEAEAEHLLVESRQRLEADVLKVAHHGSSGSSTSAFLAAVDPGYAVISVGTDNRFSHPASAVLDRLGQLRNAKVLRTDQSGTIEFITDGRRMWVRTER